MHIMNHTTPSAPSGRLDPHTLEFGRMFTPNFFVAHYTQGAWRDARIEPMHAFNLHPACMVFHYAQTVFEGLKAFRQDDGRVVVFRPDMNARRFQQSAKRLSIPPVDEASFIQAVDALVENEQHFIPDAPGCLYIRPTIIGVEATLGVKSSNEFIFFVLTLPSGKYFKESTGDGPGAVDVLVSQSVLRACHGGTGNVKTGGNYAGTLQITEHAKREGCAQVLFLDASHTHIEELGGMNFMYVRDGYVCTPQLTDTILSGVTRDSLLALAREAGLQTSEAPITIEEVVDGIEKGQITEAIACGTAAVVTAIRSLRFEDGRTVSLASAEPGTVTRQLYQMLTDIQYGRRPDRHGWVHEVCARPTSDVPAGASR